MHFNRLEAGFSAFKALFLMICLAIIAGAGAIAVNPDLLPQNKEITVSIAPKEALREGASWRMVGDWQQSGASREQSKSGNIAIEFKEVEGWETPTSISLLGTEQNRFKGIYKPIEYSEKKILTLYGSNTIGAKLGPDLVKRYLMSLGADDIQEIPGQHRDEVSYKGLFHARRQALIVELRAHGSSTGFKGLRDQKCDIGMASRKIKQKEVKMLDFLGDMTGEQSEHILALDGIAVIVNKQNKLNSLNKNQIAEIFTGQIADWRELGQSPGPIHVYARDAKSGTFDTFKSLILGKKNPLVPNAKRFDSNAKLSDAVAADKYAIGFCGLPYINNSKELAVGNNAKSSPVSPTIASVSIEKYPLTRRLYLYLPPKTTNHHAHSFIEFAKSPSAQPAVKKYGFVVKNTTK